MTLKKPRLLYLVHRVPYPPNRGDRIRSYHMLRFLATRFDVYLGTLKDEEMAPGTIEALNEMCARVHVDSVGRSRWFHAGMGVLSGGTATDGLFRCQRLRNVIDRWGKEIQFDAVLVFCSSMFQFVDKRLLADLPVVVDLVDVDSQKWLDYAQSASPLLKPVFSLEGRRLRALEQSIADRVKAVTLVSEAEANLFRSVCPNEVTLAIPNGVDLEYFQRDPDAQARKHRCVFVGALDYRANVDGLRWFCENVWTDFRQRVPDATLAVVGRNPVPAVKKLASLPGVDIVGEVPDVRPHVDTASVAIAPLRVARGIQNKILEAMALHKPVVASPQATEGLSVRPNTDLFVADSPQQWCDSIGSLFDDPDKYEKLVTNGRQYVERVHSWDACLMPFEELLGTTARDN